LPRPSGGTMSPLSGLSWQYQIFESSPFCHANRPSRRQIAENAGKEGSVIAAAVRGMDRATLEYPIKPGLIFCLDRAFPFALNEIIVEKAIGWRDRGVVGVDIAGPESATFRVADYRRLFRRAREVGLGPGV